MGDCLEMVPRDYPNISKSILLFKLIGLGFCQVKNIVQPPEFLYIFDHVCVLSTPLLEKIQNKFILENNSFFFFLKSLEMVHNHSTLANYHNIQAHEKCLQFLIFFFRPFGVSELATGTFGNVPVF